MYGLADDHVHTFRCGHAGGASREFVEQALAIGLHEIAFTDHIPLYFLPAERRDPRLAMREEQFDGYVAEVENLKREFEGRIAVHLGLEADYAEGREEELARWLSRAEWDVVLGSVHWVGSGWIDDPATSPPPSRGAGSTRHRGPRCPRARTAAATGLFDVLTHFDLPKKHGHRPAEPLRVAEEKALAAAKTAGCAIEISSAGLRKKVGEMYPEPRLLARAVALGIPVTFSSDAHAPAEVGWGYDRTVAAARDAGVGEFVTFERRRPRSHPLPP